ncbi:MAG: hypothetical protein IJ572_00900 [Bacilli bacterium]|nr:hypothetical protein [Bacilli bacterium]
MKKLFKSRFLFLILGIVIVSGISSVFAYSLLAQDVGFTPKDTTWEVDNTKEALDDLRDEFNAQEKKLFLYWKGNTFDAVTGGWSSSMNYGIWGGGNNTGINKKSAVFNSDHMDVSINSTYQYVVANTNNKIDCTNYEYINILYYASNIYWAQVAVESKTNPTYVINGSERIYGYNLVGSNMLIVSYPLTCSDPGYISFTTMRGISSDSVTTLRIYGVYLSKNKGPAN